MSLIDTYQLATGGQNLTDTFTLASNGILLEIEVTPVIPTPPRGGGSFPVTPYPIEKERDECVVKKIKVTATIKGKKYIEEVIVECKPTLKAKDIKVEVSDKDDKPKIKISFDT